MSFFLLSGETTSVGTVSTTVNAVLKAQAVIVTTADAYLFSGGSVLTTADAVLKASNLTVTTTADAYLSSAGTVATTASAVLKKLSSTVTTTASAILIPTPAFTVTTTADASLTGTRLVTTTANAVLLSEDQQLAATVDLFKLPRRARYGNAGAAFNEGKPTDDEYLFTTQNTSDLWGQLKGLAEQFGLDYYANGEGDFVLRTRNNPHKIQKLLIGDFATAPTEGTHPNAYGGTFMEWASGPVANSIITVDAARIDLIMPRGATVGVPLRSWSVTVKQGGTTIAGPFTLDPSSAETLHYYDYRTTIDGTNATVTTLYSGFFDTYDIHIASTGTDGLRYLDSLALWHTDPAKSLLPIAVSTEELALGMDTKSMMGEMRNHVIVVGRRNAAVTDSQKDEVNPENPSYEFVVASATDVGSVAKPFLSDDTTPTPNYVGYPKESIIYDQSISDKDFAEYVSRTFIYRQRQPLPAASAEHTLLPDLNLKEAVQVVEQPYNTLAASTLQYLQSIKHSISINEGVRATTVMEMTPYPEYASYEKRVDIDIDVHFNGSPVSDVLVDYVSLSGHAQQNLAEGLVKDAGAVQIFTNQTVTANAIDMTGKAWPPVPGSLFVKSTTANFTGTVKERTYLGDSTGKIMPMYLPSSLGWPSAISCKVFLGFSITNQWGVVTYNLLDSTNPFASVFYDEDMRVLTIVRKPGNISVTWKSILTVTYPKATNSIQFFDADWQTNTPYQHLHEINYSDGTPSIELPWKLGDGGALYTRHTSNFDVTYRALGQGAGTFVNPYTSNNVPFYDPYTSELGNNVSLKFSALVSGEYRISVRSKYDDTIVAYLTMAEADSSDKELHWQYLDAGTDKQFFWDGVDQVGLWNRRQSDDYAEQAYGAFAVDSKPLVGSGFYVWNREEADGYPTIALISGERDAAGKPVFGHGTYGEWYINFEVRNDTLELIPYKPYPRVTRTDKMNWVDGAPGNDVTAMIYTHLPEPNKVELEVADWKVTGYYAPDTPAVDDPASWSTNPADNPNRLINNQHPTRFRFTAVDRPGPQWAGKGDKIAVKLNRMVHLRHNLHDQFVVYSGATYPNTTVTDRKIVNRRMSVDDHTLTFEDSSWRLASTLKQVDGGVGLEWIFIPQDFKKNFRGIEEESLQFGDYLQLEEVPMWDSSKSVANSRSRLQIAFINYLFYLSAYTQDRSGRYTWCLNRKTVDKSKIINNLATHWDTVAHPSKSQDGTAVATQWPDDMNRQFRRTVVTRQWTNERVDGQFWFQKAAAERTGTAFNLGGIGYQLLTHYWKDHDPTSTTIMGPDGTNRTWASFAAGLYVDHDSDVENAAGKMPAAWNNLTRQLGSNDGFGTTSLGDWTWESDPVWVPCISRDFHGYYLLPPMPDVTVESFRARGPFQASVDYRPYRDDDDETSPNTGDDPAAAAVWNSPAYDFTDANATNRGTLFQRGAKVAWDKEPTTEAIWNAHPTSMADYTKEDSLVHFEDCRGLWSRGPRPAEQARKVAPITPYYQNLYRYTSVVSQHSRQTQKDHFPPFDLTTGVVTMFKHGVVGVPNPIPLYRVTIGTVTDVALTATQYTNGSGYHDMTFRGEYLWESSRFFPARKYGKFWSKPYNADRVQVFPSASLKHVYYDGGAWTGWKDDTAGGGPLIFKEGIGEDGENLDTVGVGWWGHSWLGGVLYHVHGGNSINIFTSLYPPFGIGPRLTTTTDMMFHMLLVNERRATEL